MINFTFIIPHYDIPDLLLRCLKSIPERNDSEIIIVDDNSPNADSYLDLYPLLRRPDISFIRTYERKGAGAARNIGLTHSRGKWILFADADDLFVEDINSILDEVLPRSEDILYFRKKTVFSDNIELISSRATWLDKIYDSYFKYGDEMRVRCLHYAPWGKIIKKKLIVDHNILFDEIPYSNDVIFSVKAGLAANRVAINDKVLYICTQRKGSLTDSFCQKPGELEMRCGVLFRAQSLLSENNLRLIQPQIPQMLTKMLLNNRKLFLHFFSRVSEIGLSKWTITYQILLVLFGKILGKFVYRFKHL